jgi:transposase
MSPREASMANQLKMATVQSILHLHSLRWSQRRIAAELQVNRETVSRYVRLSRESAPTVQGDPTPAIAPIGLPALGSSNPAIAPIPGPGAAALSDPAHAPISVAGRGSDCAGWRELIEAKQAQGLSARRIHHDLVTEHGAAVSYDSVRRFLRRLGWSKPLPFRRLESAPGQEAQVDFGSGAPIVGADGSLATIERRVAESRETQRSVREQLAVKQRILNGHFDHVVKSLLGSTAAGRIDIDMRGIHLVTDEQESSPGEAMATSGTVHSLDLACLRASIAGLGTMARLLLDDSPREGDLEPHLYARLFRLAVALERTFGDREPSFQYIVATTTPPPNDIAVEPLCGSRLTRDASTVYCWGGDFKTVTIAGPPRNFTQWNCD